MSKYFVQGNVCLDNIFQSLNKFFPWFDADVLSITIDDGDRDITFDVESYDEAKEMAKKISAICIDVLICERVPEEKLDLVTLPAEKPENGNESMSEEQLLVELRGIESQPYNKDAEREALLAQPISDLNFSVRAGMCMICLRINTFGDLVQKTAEDLMKCEKFRKAQMAEIRKKLAKFGLKLKGDD